MEKHVILPRLYSTINAPDNTPGALDEIGAAVDARGVLLSSFNQVGFNYSPKFANSIYRGLDSEIQEFSAKFVSTELEGWRKILSSPFGVPLTDFEIWSCGHDIKERADMQWIIKYLGVYRRIAFNLSPDIGWSAGLILQYDREMMDLPFSAKEKATFFIPHLSKMLELHRFVDQLRQHYRAVYSVLDRLKIGVFVTDPNGNVVVANQTSRNALDEQDGISVRYGAIKAASTEESQEISSAVDRISKTSLGVGSDSQSTVIVNRPSGKRPYILTISPLNDGSAEIERNFAGVLMFLFDTETPADIDVSSLVALAKLTKAEAEIALLMLRGYSDRDISEMRDVTYETVRTQIKGILAKTSVSNRLEFVRKAATISPPIQ